MNLTIEELPQAILRAMEPEDLDILYRIENDFELWAVGATNVPYSRYALHEYIASASGDIYTDRQVRLIIEDTHHDDICAPVMQNKSIVLHDAQPGSDRDQIGIGDLIAAHRIHEVVRVSESGKRAVRRDR